MFALLAASMMPILGCRASRSVQPTAPATPPPATASQYHLDSFDWRGVARVLVLPVGNESRYNRTGWEVRKALASELQRLGRFEVVSPPDDHPAFLSETMHVTGRFNEVESLNIAHTFGADVIIYATVTEYMPYGRARLGLVVQAVSPFDCKVVASVDGLWDTVSIDVARRARAFYHTPIDARGPVMAKVKELIQTPTEDGRADELAIESPALYQRFVCNEVVQHLVVFPGDRRGSPGGAPSNVMPAGGGPANYSPCSTPIPGAVNSPIPPAGKAGPADPIIPGPTFGPAN